MTPCTANGTANHADAVVVGAGAAGLMCALAAAQGGARAVLLDQHSLTGGTFWMSGGSFTAANSRLTKLAGIPDSAERFFQDAMEKGQRRANPDLVRLLAEQAGPVLDWFVDRGMELRSDRPQESPIHEAMSLPRTYSPKEGGKGFLDVLRPAVEAAAREKRIDLRLKTRFTRFIQGTDGRVGGVEAVGPDGVVQHLLAPNVVLAGGGYGGSHAMIEHYNPDQAACITMCPPFADGSNIAASEAIGAALINMDILRFYPGALASPSNPHRGISLKYLVRLQPQHIDGAIWVSSAGKRVANEDATTMDGVREVMSALPDKTIFLIFDQGIRDATPRAPVSGWDWPKLDKIAASNSNKQVAVASTITELGAKLGVHAENLAATIEEWNGCVRRGTDPLFGRQPRLRLETPPYYGVIAKGCLMMTMGGIKVNGRCEVIDTGGRPMPGLYAIGEAAGMAQYAGVGGISGFGDVAALVTGKVAGEEIAAMTRS